MDCVFDMRNKNWPIQDYVQVGTRRILVTMCENGFKAVTQGTSGVGKILLVGDSYSVRLPAQIIDAQEWVVSFTRVDNLVRQKN
jgi:hypothetical protein